MSLVYSPATRWRLWLAQIFITIERIGSVISYYYKLFAIIIVISSTKLKYTFYLNSLYTPVNVAAVPELNGV